MKKIWFSLFAALLCVSFTLQTNVVIDRDSPTIETRDKGDTVH
ncbi:hypothetical protein J1TS1_00690 [Shouchella clausii]|nr:hypothetical protein DB29_02657 [Shouchella clausii]GIN05924.1 hypothetical protein J1TS1_00690 [Shouchella clausii]